MKNTSKYWDMLNKASDSLLDEYGYDHFKESVARIYNDDMGLEELKKSTIDLWEKLYDIIPSDVLSSISEPMVGTPRYILCDNRPVTADLGVSLYDYWVISQNVGFENIDSILEIGGGYGRIAYVVKQKNRFLKYTMCDVEPALSVAKWYLPQVVDHCDIEFVKPDALKGKFDLVIACNCLHEMPPEQLHYYFNYVNDNAKYFYFTCWNDTTMPVDGIRWQRDDYPIKDKWTKIFNDQYIKQDYFKALYKI